MDDGFDFSHNKRAKFEGELEVTGVSRSGRVRKKSSKLTDFESLDELDMRSPKSRKEKQDFSPLVSRPLKKEKVIIKEPAMFDEEEGNYAMKSDFGNSDESENDLGFPNDESSVDSLVGSDIEDSEESYVENKEDFRPVVQESIPPQNWKKPVKKQPNKVMATPVERQDTLKKVKSPGSRKAGGKTQTVSILAATSSSASHLTSPENRVVGGRSGGSSAAAPTTEVFKPVGTTPLDVAAHLRLLGESLTIIGERLTEHEGQIAVSGSFSVLLDSLLCALGPLMCLTQQVPELNVIPQEQLSQLMDNIAYIMPGL